MIRMRGFSLLELVVIIVIAAILAALALPQIDPPQTEAVWFREQVRAAVRHAQREAVAQRRLVWVHLPSATQLRLCYDSPCATPLYQMTGTEWLLNAPAGVTITASTAPFSFNGLGQPSPIAGLTLTVAGATITVEAETGYVH